MERFGLNTTQVVVICVLLVTIIGAYHIILWLCKRRKNRLRDEFLEKMLGDFYEKFWACSWWFQAIIEMILKDDYYDDFLCKPEKVGKKLTQDDLKQIQRDVTELAKTIEEQVPTEWQKAQREYFQPFYEKLVYDFDKHCMLLMLLDELVALVYLRAKDGKADATFYDYDAEALSALVDMEKTLLARKEKIENRFDVVGVDLLSSEKERKEFEKLKKSSKQAAEENFLWYSGRIGKVIFGALEDLPEWLQKDGDRAVV